MPAAAVIPAPLAYIKVAAVKKLVVGSRECALSVPARCASQGVATWWGRRGLARTVPGFLAGVSPSAVARRHDRAGVLDWVPAFGRDPFTLNKSECSKQAPPRSNGSAWNNGRGLVSPSVGLVEAGNDQEERTGAEVCPGER